MTDWLLELSDSLPAMTGMADGMVDAIVTSPPYADQRAYEPGETGGRRGNIAATARVRAQSRAARSGAPDRWVEQLRPFTDAMLPLLAPHGSMMLNLGVVLRDGVEHECTDRILDGCRAAGWRLLQRLVWHKPNGQVPSAPGYLTVAHEFVLWLAPNPGLAWRAHCQPAGSRASREVRKPHSPASAARIRSLYTGAGTHRKQSNGTPAAHRLHPDGARPTTVLRHPVGGRPNPNRHPARMPLGLARDLVAMCCPPGGLVLDPFAGDCTTGVAALRLGRRFIGIEIDPAYEQGGRANLERWWADPAPAPAPEPDQLVLT